MRSRSLGLAAVLGLSVLFRPLVLSADVQTVRPVATNISGSVIVQSADGSLHEVIKTLILHSGDVLSTGPNSVATVSVADVGKVVVGPASAALTHSNGSNLWLDVSSGQLCLESDTPDAGINAGALTLAVTSAPAIFDVRRDAGDTTVAVYRGGISVGIKREPSLTLGSGQAAVSVHDENPQQTSLATVKQDFEALHCPDPAVVASALAGSSQVQPAGGTPSSGGAHAGGGIFGWLLGLAAIAAAAGAHGGGNSTAASTSTTNPDLTPEPTPTTSVGPTSTPTSSPTPTASPTVGPTPSATPTIGPTPTATPTPAPTPTPTASAFGPLVVSQTSVGINGIGNSQTFQASEASYPGPLNAASSNIAVASVTPASGTGSVTFSVLAVEVGNASILVTDDHGGQQSVLASVVIGAISITPITLAFSGPGSASQTFAAHDSKSRTYLALSSNPGVATVAPLGGHDHKATFLVVPVGVGTASILVTDDAGSQAVVSVGVDAAIFDLRRKALEQPPAVVKPRAALSISAANLTLNMTARVQRVAVSESGYTGMFRARSSNQSVATVDPPSTQGPACDLFITAHAPGIARVFVLDDHGGERVVEVTVAGSRGSLNPVRSARPQAGPSL